MLFYCTKVLAIQTYCNHGGTFSGKAKLILHLYFTFALNAHCKLSETSLQADYLVVWECAFTLASCNMR